nr:MAG TPA: hypothetical protein [Caudoviricetes sp.]
MGLIHLYCQSQKQIKLHCMIPEESPLQLL